MGDPVINKHGPGALAFLTVWSIGLCLMGAGFGELEKIRKANREKYHGRE